MLWLIVTDMFVYIILTCFVIFSGSLYGQQVLGDNPGLRLVAGLQGSCHWRKEAKNLYASWEP